MLYLRSRLFQDKQHLKGRPLAPTRSDQLETIQAGACMFSSTRFELHNYLRPQGHAFKSHFLLNGYKKKKKCKRAVYFPDKQCYVAHFKAFPAALPPHEILFSLLRVGCLHVTVCVCVQREGIYIFMPVTQRSSRPAVLSRQTLCKIV